MVGIVQTLVAVFIVHASLHVYNKFCLTYFANPRGLCIISFNFTLSGKVLTMSGRLRSSQIQVLLWRYTTNLCPPIM